MQQVIPDRYRAQMVQVSIAWGGELEEAEADVVEGLFVDADKVVGVLDLLVDRGVALYCSTTVSDTLGIARRRR